MGRGRQKAKQTKIARKLKYLTTDTDYDELAKELSTHDDENFESVDDFNGADTPESRETSQAEYDAENKTEGEDKGEVKKSEELNEEELNELDEYAQWAAEAAKRAEEQQPAKKAAPHKPFPMPFSGVKSKSEPKPKSAE